METLNGIRIARSNAKTSTAPGPIPSSPDNPTATDVSHITPPGPHRALSHDNITRDPEEIPPARELAIRAHHAAVLLKAD